MKRYLVWVCIEECDEENDEYTECDAPGSELASFDTYEEAWDYACTVKQINEPNP